MINCWNANWLPRAIYSLSFSWLSVFEFKAHCRLQFPLQTPLKPIFVEKTHTLRDVIRAMDDGNLHRVFVVSKHAQPHTDRRSPGHAAVTHSALSLRVSCAVQVEMKNGAPIPTHCISQRESVHRLQQYAWATEESTTAYALMLGPSVACFAVAVCCASCCS